MTRKDYIKIAQAFNKAYAELSKGEYSTKEILENLMKEFCSILKADNYNFKQEKFVDACKKGIEQ